MRGYRLVNLQILIEEVGDDKAKSVLSDFSCPLNPDVEGFLAKKAIEFSRQRLSQTHLVFTSYQGSVVLVGYFTLANKDMIVSTRHLKGKLKKRLSRFSTPMPEIKALRIPMPLIGQLGKNYNHGYNSLITGDRLLDMACEQVKKVQLVLGGRYVYLECEDKPALLEFYERNGFCQFEKRKLDSDETGLTGEYLVQMLKYIE